MLKTETQDAKREWIRPDFKRQSLKDALAGVTNNFDGTVGFS